MGWTLGGLAGAVAVGALLAGTSCRGPATQAEDTEGLPGPGAESPGSRPSPGPPLPPGTATLADVPEAAAAVTPSVVNVSTSRRVEEPRTPFGMDPFLRDFFGFGPGGEGPSRTATSLGSGVVVRDGGTILTNAHVVEGAEEVMVSTPSGREYRAEVVGVDPPSDLAVIRAPDLDAPPLPFADSDALRVGETVLAVGNPFGVGQTVTMGIVSATGRARMGIRTYENFIQTDAAINPGNSGGALVNLRGELVGINTAILSKSGGFQGMGFAIPVNLARPVMDSILEHGRMIRAWLGVQIQEITPELADAMGLAEAEGALVAAVEEGSPADGAGIRPGDLIVSVDGVAVGSAARLRLVVSGAGVGTPVELGLVRDGRPLQARVVLGELPGQEAPRGRSAPQAERGEEARPLAGVRVTDLTPSLARQLGLPPEVRGALVLRAAPGSPAFEAGLREGDVIVEAQRRDVRSTADLRRALEEARGRRTVLRVVRDGGSLYLALPPP